MKVADVARADHPRSRGVYAFGSGVAFFSAGSSPLARGLPAASAKHMAPRRDHPRSRGVYREFGRVIVHVQGSSPLARGLHIHDAEHCHAFRIIPARAGFTCTVRDDPSDVEDHPRSRGVYCS